MYPATFRKSLITICGATAVGKSGLALDIAQRLESVIFSADSRQVYREFNIGTAKPTSAQQQLVPHYLIDICDPTETLTVASYQQQAQALIEGRGARGELRGAGEGAGELRVPTKWGLGARGASGSPPSGVGGKRGAGGKSLSILSSAPLLPCPPALLVGGTGLYIRSIVQGLKIPLVAPVAELRSQLLSLGQTQLYAMLQQVDRVAAQKIHANDPVRTVRALEVYYVTGRPITEQQGENPPDYPILQIGLDCDSTALRDRITLRTEQMIADGLVTEVEYLCQKYGFDLPLLNTLGYQEIKQYLAGDISLNEAKNLTVLHTRQFAKRQKTWFRASPQIEWFDANSPDLVEQVWQRVQEFCVECCGNIEK